MWKKSSFAEFYDHIMSAIKGESDDAAKGFVTRRTGEEAKIVLDIQCSVNDFIDFTRESINFVPAINNLNVWNRISHSYGANDLTHSNYSIIYP